MQVIIVIFRVAFYTLLERRVLGYIQLRKGPNKPGPVGLFVPLADATKLMSKELRVPRRRNKALFYIVPCFALMIPLALWSIYPTTFEVLIFKYSAMFFFCISAVGVYVILGAGWRSNRRYSMLGAVRAVAQSISYEVCLSIVVIHYILFYEYHINNIKMTPIGVYLYLIIFLLFVTALAETNRSPFDFSEGESELVRGFNTEFRAVSFLLIFLAEYIVILFISSLLRRLFNSRGNGDLYFFLMLWGFLYIWCRGTLPRLRYDQLISLAWKRVLPLVLTSLACVVLA